MDPSEKVDRRTALRKIGLGTLGLTALAGLADIVGRSPRAAASGVRGTPATAGKREPDSAGKRERIQLASGNRIHATGSWPWAIAARHVRRITGAIMTNTRVATAVVIALGRSALLTAYSTKTWIYRRTSAELGFKPQINSLLGRT